MRSLLERSNASEVSYRKDAGYVDDPCVIKCD